MLVCHFFGVFYAKTLKHARGNLQIAHS